MVFIHWRETMQCKRTSIKWKSININQKAPSKWTHVLPIQTKPNIQGMLAKPFRNPGLLCFSARDGHLNVQESLNWTRLESCFSLHALFSNEPKKPRASTERAWQIAAWPGKNSTGLEKNKRKITSTGFAASTLKMRFSVARNRNPAGIEKESFQKFAPSWKTGQHEGTRRGCLLTREQTG